MVTRGGHATHAAAPARYAPSREQAGTRRTTAEGYGRGGACPAMRGGCLRRRWVPTPAWGSASVALLAHNPARPRGVASIARTLAANSHRTTTVSSQPPPPPPPHAARPRRSEKKAPHSKRGCSRRRRRSVAVKHAPAITRRHERPPSAPLSYPADKNAVNPPKNLTEHTIAHTNTNCNVPSDKWKSETHHGRCSVRQNVDHQW